MNFSEEERLICVALGKDPEEVLCLVNSDCTVETNAPMALLAMEAHGFVLAVRAIHKQYTPELAEALCECKRHDGKDDGEYLYNAGLRDAYSRVLGVVGRPKEVGK